MDQRNILLGILVLLVVMVGIASAQDTLTVSEETLREAEEDLPDEAGVTPDSALHGIDRALERISLALTFGKSAKAQKGLEHAHERLLETKALLEEDKIEEAEEAELLHKKEMQRMRERISELDEGSEDINSVLILERKLQAEENEVDNIRERVRIKIDSLTPEQKRRLLAFLSSLETDVADTTAEIDTKRERIRHKISEETGLSEEEVEKQIGKFREKIKVKAEIFEDESIVRVSHTFVTSSTDTEAIVKEIMEKFPLTAEEAQQLLKIEQGDEADEDEIEDIEDDVSIVENPNELTQDNVNLEDSTSDTTEDTLEDATEDTDLGEDDSNLDDEDDSDDESDDNNSGSDDDDSDEDDSDDDAEDDSDDEDKNKERLRIKVEVKHHQGADQSPMTRVKIDLRFVNGASEDEIINEIVERTQLTEKEIMNALHLNKQGSGVEKKEIKAKVEKIKHMTRVVVDWNGEKREFNLNTIDKEEIIERIALELGTTVEEIRDYVHIEEQNTMFKKSKPPIASNTDSEDNEESDDNDEDSEEEDNNSGTN